MLESEPLTDDHLTSEDAIKNCYLSAKSRGYAIFALQNGGRCATSADAEETYDMYGSSTNCSSDGKGGIMVNQVYRIGKLSLLLRKCITYQMLDLK